MTEQRVITGIWSDAYEGRDDQGNARLRVQLIGPDGPISADLPLQVSVINGPSLNDERNNAYQLLGAILRQQKITNIHLSAISGVDVDETEVEWRP